MSTETTRADYDSPWKFIVERYFPEFTAFFFPEVYAAIDWTQEYVFLDKELQQVVRDAETGARRVDKLVRVTLKKSGQEAWILIHIEIQGQPETAFTERMYIYNYRLFDKYRRRIVSLAVLTDSDPRWRPALYEYELLGCRVSLEFPVVKLLDFAADWDALAASSNPFAIVTMAHLQTQKTRHDLQERYAAKLTLAKMLYKKGYTRQDILELFRFMDWIMTLPPELEEEYMAAVTAYEKGENVPYLAPFERMAIEKGLKQGLEQGLEQGERQASYELLLMTLQIRFDDVPEQLTARLEAIEDTAVLKELHRQALLTASLDEFTAQIPE